MNTYTGYITQLMHDEIFVFGSNPEGRHGKGTARIALDKYGAIWGQGRGLQGCSYGIVTTNLRNPIRPNVESKDIIAEIRSLYEYAQTVPHMNFLVAYTADGTNLSGYKSDHLAYMFYAAGGKHIPENIVFEDKFAELIKSHIK